MPELHEYKVDVAWSGGRDGEGTTSADSRNIAVPKELGGTGQGSNPEELLTSAVGSCYSITLGIIAANRKIPIQDLRVEAVGQVESHGPSLTFKKVTIRPTVTLDPSATDEQLKLAEDMARKADQYCPITNAIRGKVEVEVQPTVRRS